MGMSERFSPREISRVLFRRKGLIISLFLIVSIGLSFAVAKQPERYEATGMLLVKRSRGDLVLTPSDTRNANFTVSLPPQDLVSQTEFLKHRSLLEAVVQKLGLDQRAQASETPPVVQASLVRMFDGLPAWSSWLGRSGNGLSARDAAVASLERNLTVQTIPNSNVIEVRYRTGDPEKAAAVVNTLLTLYLDRNLEIQRNPGVTGFFAAQRDLAGDRLKQSEDALKRFQAEAALVDAQVQVEAYSRRLAEARANVVDARFDFLEYEKKLAANMAFVAAEPDRIVRTMTTRYSPMRRAIEDRLLVLEMERTKLLQKYTEQDRRVLDLEAEIASLKTRIVDEPEWVPESQTSDINQQKREAEAQVLATQIGQDRRRIRQESWNEIADEMQKRLSELAVKMLAKEQLQRETKANEEAYLLYRRKVEEARIHEAMDQSRIMNVSIAEMASPPMGPIGPQKDLSFAFAVMVGAVTGVGGAFLREFFDNSISAEEQLTSILDAPVLASIPEEKG